MEDISPSLSLSLPLCLSLSLTLPVKKHRRDQAAHSSEEAPGHFHGYLKTH